MGLALLFLFFCGGFIQNFITRLLITTTNRDLRWLNSASVYFVLVTQKYEKKCLSLTVFQNTTACNKMK